MDCFIFLVAEVGFEPHGLRVMSTMRDSRNCQEDQGHLAFFRCGRDDQLTTDAQRDSINNHRLGQYEVKYFANSPFFDRRSQTNGCINGISQRTIFQGKERQTSIRIPKSQNPSKNGSETKKEKYIIKYSHQSPFFR